jgi:hypothetical protein
MTLMDENPKNVIILEPLRVLRSFNDDQFEQMIEEWQTFYKGKKYKRVERIGGAGDKGRDIRCTGNGLLEDLYIFQAKNYNHKLGKSDVFPDIAKCCYYTFRGDYKTPLEYKFISPLGISPDLDKLFADRAQLKKELIESWDTMCASKIHKSNKILLEGDLLVHVDSFNFSIFGYVTPQELIDGVKETCYYIKYFGQLNKTRPLADAPPPEIAKNELVYIGKIIEAYDEYLGKHIENIIKLKEIDPALWNDFNRHREYFYSAEVLRTFSRDVYPPDSQWFEGVKLEVYHAIIQDIEDDAKNGFERLKNVMNRMTSLIVGSAIAPTAIPIYIQDRKGLCHHLANEREDVRWKK